jgi:hypothetical protein
MNQAPPDMARHALDATGDHDVIGALGDLGGSEIYRVEAGRAETGDLHARRLDGIARLESRATRDDGARFHDGIDAAHDDVIDRFGVQPVAVAQRFQRFRREAHRRHLVQRAILLAATARRADVIVNENFGHPVSSPWRRLGRELFVSTFPSPQRGEGGPEGVG